MPVDVREHSNQRDSLPNASAMSESQTSFIQRPGSSIRRPPSTRPGTALSNPNASHVVAIYENRGARGLYDHWKGTSTEAVDSRKREDGLMIVDYRHRTRNWDRVAEPEHRKGVAITGALHRPKCAQTLF